MFVRLFARHEPDLHRYVMSLVLNLADAEEIVQETAAALWRKFQDYDADSPFLPWAMRFAYYEVLAFRKRSRRLRQFSDALLESLADERAAAQPLLEAQRAALSHCLSKLSPDHRELLHERYSSDESIADLARRTGRQANTLYKTLNRLRLRLHDCITQRLRAGGWLS